MKEIDIRTLASMPIFSPSYPKDLIVSAIANL